MPQTERQYHIDLGTGRAGRVHPPPRRPGPDREGRQPLRQRRVHAPAPRVRLGDGHVQGPPRVGHVDRHRHGQRGDRRRRGPRHRRAAHVHPHRVVRRAPRRHRAWGTSSSRTGAVRLESTTSYFVHDGYPAVADYAAVAALLEAAHGLGHTAHLGLTATAPGFYGAQGRPIRSCRSAIPDLADEMERQGVVNFEMEASALLVLAMLAGCRAGVVCTAYAQRRTGAFVQGELKDRAEAACIDTGLEALRLLAVMDEATTAAGERHWRPSLWAGTPPSEAMRRSGAPSRAAQRSTLRGQRGVRGWLRPIASRTSRRWRSKDPADHDEERQERHQGHLSHLWRQRLPHRRLTETDRGRRHLAEPPACRRQAPATTTQHADPAAAGRAGPRTGREPRPSNRSGLSDSRFPLGTIPRDGPRGESRAACAGGADLARGPRGRRRTARTRPMTRARPSARQARDRSTSGGSSIR